MAKETTLATIDHLIERYPVLAPMEEPLKAAVETIVNCYRKGGKLLICGNGGSAAEEEFFGSDAQKNADESCPSREGQAME